jgi:acetyl esterase/lipase
MASLTADLPPNDRVQSEDRMIPGPDGDDLRVRIHRPIDQSEVLPCFYHIHGGGMIIGSVDGEDLQLAVFVEQVGCVVVSVDYRLAPENPNPAPVEDCYAGLVWTAEHADELRIDPTRIAVGGESAGGGLAAATALMARDRNGPDLVLQYLIYPMLDNRNETPSSREFAGDWPGWPREMNYLGWEALLGESTGGDELLPYAAPARSKDLSDLPPTYIDVGGLEVFRDEDIDYAKRLMQAGVDVEFHFTPESSMGGSLSLPQPT